jgi:hypothetical protein
MNPFKSSSPPSQPAPQAPPPPPSTNDAADAAAEAQKRGKINRGAGYSSTILTSAAGDTSEAPTYKKVLLGS